MDSLFVVKAEIKVWERSFRSSNARDPTIQDIKLQPLIAEKYKLYKKLSKAAAQETLQPVPSTSSNTDADVPSTPSRSRTRISHQPSLLLSKPRVAHTTAPLSTFNPFSPQKNKGKQREAAANPTGSRSNPFASPLKINPKVRAPQPRVLSPDPFPILQLQHPSESSITPPRSPPAPTSAISRARKRLRGEPVSPSPNKEKRRRVGPQSTLPFTTLAPDSSDDGEDDDDDVDMDASIITDSPVKMPAGGKSFKLLFDESSASTNTGPLNGKAPIDQTKSTTRIGALFGVSASSHVDEDMEWGIVDSGLGGGKSRIPLYGKVTENGIPNLSKSVKVTSPKADDLARKPFPPGAPAESPLYTEMEVVVKNKGTAGVRQSQLPPSSPPLADVPVDTVKKSLSTKVTGKAKAKYNVRRRKGKILESDGEVDEDELDIPVKIVHRPYARQFVPREENDLNFDDADSILSYTRRVAPQADGSVDTDAGPHVGAGTSRFDVDLPDKLRQVLALESTEAKVRDSREEQVFKGLLYGQRSSHYDPIKGGNIWDAGEDDVRVDEEGVVRRDVEGEDDWEGEPVPWEVGEL